MENCGTWISAVRVFDADSGLVVWSASAVRGSDGGIEHTVGQVELGQPPESWETTGVAPAVGQPLRIVVESTLDSSVTLDPPALAPGEVYFDGRLRSGGFSDYCGAFYPYGSWVYGSGIFVVSVGVLSVALLVLRARRRASTRRLPAPPLGG